MIEKRDFFYSYAFDVCSVYFVYGKMCEQETQESNPFTSFLFADDVPPYFKTEPVRSQLHLERNRLVLTCMAEGSWPLEFKWIHNSTELTRFSLEYRSEIQRGDYTDQSKTSTKDHVFVKPKLLFFIVSRGQVLTHCLSQMKYTNQNSRLTFLTFSLSICYMSLSGRFIRYIYIYF